MSTSLGCDEPICPTQSSPPCHSISWLSLSIYHKRRSSNMSSSQLTPETAHALILRSFEGQSTAHTRLVGQGAGADPISQGGTRHTRPTRSFSRPGQLSLTGVSVDGTVSVPHCYLKMIS